MNGTRVTEYSPRAYGCRAWDGCTPGNRCPEHGNAEPEQIGDLAVALFAAMRPDRPLLYLAKGGKR